jgi:uncharacterized protein
MIIDCAFQPLDLRTSNCYGAQAEALRVQLCRQHRGVAEAEPGSDRGAGEFFGGACAAAGQLFDESPVDVAIYQSLVMRGAFYSGPATVSAGAAAMGSREKRIVLFGGTSIIHVGQAIVDIREQHKRYGITGVTLYPQSLLHPDEGASRLVRDGFADVLEAIRALGIRHVSLYRTPCWGLPGAGVPGELQLLTDLASGFPELAFQIMVGDVSGIPSAGALAGRHPNVYLNLQGIFSLVVTRPREFYESIARLAADAGYDKLLFASGWGGQHPSRLISAFLDTEMPSELVSGYRLPPFDGCVKSAVLGETARRLLDLPQSLCPLPDHAHTNGETDCATDQIQ